MNVQELEAEVRRHNRLYWVEDAPEISDLEYDKLSEQLRSVAPKSKVLEEVQGATSDRPKVRHDIAMLSLDKVYTFQELVDWARSVARSLNEEFTLMSKKDGMSGESSPGLLVSRGDGETGFDCSDRIPYIKNIPEETGMRGEICVTVLDFAEKKPQRQNGDYYKNERSAASGLMNNTDVISDDVLTFVPFDIDALTLTMRAIEDETEEGWTQTVQEFMDGPYPLDGLVLALADKDYGKSLGETGHHPKHSMALKFTNPKANTKLIGVRWTAGKYKLTPTAILDPVQISGFTNSKASLHNYDNITKLGLRIGDTVEVERCGDIIPQVTRVVSKGKEESRGTRITLCPACSEPVCYVKPDLVCTNSSCPGKMAKALYDSIKRIGIENVGPATVESIIEAGFYDLVSVLNMNLIDWESLPGFANNSAVKALEETFRITHTPIEDYKLLAATNVKGVGITLSKKILSQISLSELVRTSFTYVFSIDGVGPETATRLMHELNKSADLPTLMNMITIKESPVGIVKKGTVCFTGKSDQTRSFWVATAEGRGYEVKSTATSDLTLLVCADPNSNSAKMKKAIKNGTKLVSYEDFLELN